SLHLCCWRRSHRRRVWSESGELHGFDRVTNRSDSDAGTFITDASGKRAASSHGHFAKKESSSVDRIRETLRGSLRGLDPQRAFCVCGRFSFTKLSAGKGGTTGLSAFFRCLTGQYLFGFESRLSAF